MGPVVIGDCVGLHRDIINDSLTLNYLRSSEGFVLFFFAGGIAKARSTFVYFLPH